MFSQQNSWSRPARSGNSSSPNFNKPRYGGNNRSHGQGHSRPFGRPHGQNNNKGKRNDPEFDVRGYIQQMANKPVVAAPAPYVNKHKFADFGFVPQIEHNLRSRGYTTPTPIKDQIIPAGLDGKDVVGIAHTGTGKTAAFLLPLIDQIARNKLRQVLVLTPTRELAIQVNDELKIFAGRMPIYSTICVGGTNIGPQIRDLKRHPQFVIGTPGRIKDLMQRGDLQLRHFHAVVLDEVDRMLDMGFVNDMKTILRELPASRQSLFFSATLDKATEEIMKNFVTDYVKVVLTTGETTPTVRQELIEYRGDEDKLERLVEYLGRPDVFKAVVFVRTKHGADRLTKRLSRTGIKADAIHGNKTQNYRQRAMLNLKAGKIQALVATDVAARGLDIDGLSHVINFDLPGFKEDYVHRIGRVGRGDNGEGVAASFVAAR